MLSLPSSSAAYELKTTEERRESHMKYGLLLCSNTLVNGAENNSSLFFTSVNQINKGGPDAIQDPNQRSKIAVLNLKAGKLSILLSDHTTALKFFEHGISYIREDCWTVHYDISVDLYDAAAEAASALANIEAVKSYTDELIENAHSFDDSLHCKLLLLIFPYTHLLCTYNISFINLPFPHPILWHNSIQVGQLLHLLFVAWACLMSQWMPC